MRHQLRPETNYSLLPEPVALSDDDDTPEKVMYKVEELDEENADSTLSQKSREYLEKSKAQQKDTDGLKSTNNILSTKLSIVSDPNYNEKILA